MSSCQLSVLGGCTVSEFTAQVSHDTQAPSVRGFIFRVQLSAERVGWLHSFGFHCSGES